MDKNNHQKELINPASRGAHKLEKALDTFNIDPTGMVCVDLGSSSGGFVDCLLQRGAKRCYAVEKGRGILDWKLRNDPRVIVKERINALFVEIPEKADLVTIDVSWTKQDKIIEKAISLLKTDGKIISLVKPQYEANKNELKHGVVKDKETRINILERVIRAVVDKSGDRISTIKKTESPIMGKKGGNIEFLLYIEKK